MRKRICCGTQTKDSWHKRTLPGLLPIYDGIPSAVDFRFMPHKQKKVLLHLKLNS